MKPSTLMCLVVALAVPRFADCATLRMGAEGHESKLLERSSGSSSRSISNKTVSLDTAVLRKGSRRRAYVAPPRRRRNPCASCTAGQYCQSSARCVSCPAGQYSSGAASFLQLDAVNSGHRVNSSLSIGKHTQTWNPFSSTRRRQPACTGTCWDAYVSNYRCAGYESVGYVCKGGYCAACDPGGTPNSCAVRRPAGSTPNVETGQCSGGGSACSVCSAGTYSDVGSGSCSACASGRYSGAEWGSCNAHRTCSPGQYVSRAGSATYDSTCQTCAAGKISTSSNAATCTACPVGRSQGTAGQTQCTACPDGTGAPTEGSGGCGTCAAGTFAGTAETSCQPCTAGQYSASGAHACTSCVAGRFSASASSSTCTVCAAGKWSTAGSDACTKCSAGMFSSEAAAQCTVCAAGTFAALSGASSCEQCAVGKYGATSGSHHCEPAPFGHFVAVLGSVDYLACAEGTYQGQEGMTKCKGCPDGTWAGLTGADECAAHQTCGTGKESAPGEDGTAKSDTRCKLCDPGYSSDSTEQCKPCQIGFAQSSEGAASCYECGAGQQTTNKTVGSIGCSSCPVGKASPDNGKCVDCAAGSFTAAFGADSCQSCDSGKFSVTVGGSTCDNCPPGKTGETTGSTECKTCAVGRYMSFAGSFLGSCNECLENTFAEVRGSVKCTACPAGKHQPMTGRWDCVDAPTTTAAAPTTTAGAGQNLLPCPRWMESADYSNYDSENLPPCAKKTLTVQSVTNVLP